MTSVEEINRQRFRRHAAVTLLAVVAVGGALVAVAPGIVVAVRAWVRETPTDVAILLVVFFILVLQVEPAK